MFKEEINTLESIDFKAFVENALKLAPESFKEDENLIAYTKKVFHITDAILSTDQVTGSIRDVILSGVLLSDFAQNEEEKYKDIHPLLVRPLLKPVEDDLVPQFYEGILRVIESHEGTKMPIQSLQPKPGSAEHLVALAHAIAKSEKINVALN